MIPARSVCLGNTVDSAHHMGVWEGRTDWQLMVSSFGPYEVLQQVAEGSTGTVYRVRHTELDRIAAVKELSPAMRQVPGLLERMRTEAEVLAELDSPNIVTVYDYVEEPDRIWIAEEWVNGASLEAILKQAGTLSPEQSVGVIRGAMMGLAHAHEHGVVHRDIAPTNILADTDGTSMLVDFGLAAPVGASDALGTPAYLSPEAAAGEPVVKPSDVYSAAAVLFALLSGRPPFAGPDAATLLRHHREDPAPILDGHGADLQDLIARSLDKDPTARPVDAAAFLAELEAAAERRFGAGWLARASITGLVATTVAAGATGVAAVGGSATATTIIDTAASNTAASTTATATSAATKTGNKIFRLSLKQGIVAAIATVAVVAGIAFAANAISDQREENRIKEKAAAAAKAKADAKAAFIKAAPIGQWIFVSTIVSTGFANESVGDTGTFTWTLTSNCKGEEACGGTAKSSSGNSFTYTWDGTSLVRAPVGAENVKETCVDAQTGKKTPGSTVNAEFEFAWTPLKSNSSSSKEPPTELTGSYTVTKTYSKYVNCDEAKPITSKTNVVVTKK